LAADLLIFAELGIGAGQRVVKAELDLVGSASGNRKGRCQLRDTRGTSRLDDAPTVELSLMATERVEKKADSPDGSDA
jgi:hypothetical protein